MFTFNNNTDGDQQCYNYYLSGESQSSLGGDHQNNINIVNYTQDDKRHSAESSNSSGGVVSNHTISQKNIQKGGIVMSTTSLMSGDCNYNSRMEEAAFELIKIDEESSIPKIFDPQF